MTIWLIWHDTLVLLRPAFSRHQTFLWFILCVAGLSIRQDNLGVSSIVRAMSLKPKYYDSLLRCCHSPAIKIDKLYALWTKVVLSLFVGQLEKINDRIVLIADGKKIAKSGKKMPAVKKLHQESDNNSKPQFIMGHSTQCVGLLAHSAAYWFCVPLIMKIHEGLIFSNRDTRTLLDKLIQAIAELSLPMKYYLVADAYYCSGKVIKPLLDQDNHLISRAKSNCVAERPLPKRQTGKRKPGRPKQYGEKVKLKNLFRSNKSFQQILSPIYDEKDVILQVRTIDLMWRASGSLIRFVLVKHPTRGRIILTSTDLTLSADQIIRLYGLRFKIELTFKQASQVIGAYGYHFWMKEMKPLKRNAGNQYLHRASDRYRKLVLRKLHAYHVFLQMGVITQGMMQYLSAGHSDLVWRNFGSWLRTIRKGVVPSERVVAMAMRNTFSEFLIVKGDTNELAKFISIRQDTDYKRTFEVAA